MKIHSYAKEYNISFHKNLTLLEPYVAEKNNFFVIDEKVYELYKETLFLGLENNNFLLLTAAESIKNIDSALEICDRMASLPAKRNSRLISVGGGIIQDITGFVATILYRGINWTFMPTTLLAACDSCIGGKSSLNFKGYKNILGTFYPPDEVLICSEVFKTLSQLDFQSGLGEVVKFNIMMGQVGLSEIEKSIDNLIHRDLETIDMYVARSLNFKKTFIESDEFDRGIRIKLNYAHTFGHAIETSTEYAIPHGTAVAIGSIIANHISIQRGILDKDIARRIENVLTQIIAIKSGISIEFSKEKIIEAIKNDKKRKGEGLVAVLMNTFFEFDLINDLQVSEIEHALLYTSEIIKNSLSDRRNFRV